MPKLERCTQNSPNDPEFIFDCPGCGETHWFKTTGERPCWTFDGDMEAPTVSPSIMVQRGLGGRNGVCHFFIIKGSIQFCADSTHSLAGKTVPMVDVDA